MAYEPPKVSRYFMYDWQFAVDMSKLPLLRPASLFIGFMPLLLKASTTLFGVTIVTIPWSAWIWWWASVAFIASWTIIRFRCPHLIQHYRHYGEYCEQQHSHRWIVWLFYNTITTLTAWETIVRETLDKGISVRVSDVKPANEFRVCPLLVKRDRDALPAPFQIPADATVHIFFPVNIDRDIYVPIHCDGDRRLLLLQEDDPQLANKEKELFWILFTQAAKESPKSRVAFWVLFALSVGLLGFNVLKNVWVVVWG